LSWQNSTHGFTLGIQLLFFASGATISVLLVQPIESSMGGKKIFSREALQKRNIKLPADISLPYKLFFKRSIIAALHSILSNSRFEMEIILYEFLLLIFLTNILANSVTYLWNEYHYLKMRNPHDLFSLLRRKIKGEDRFQTGTASFRGWCAGQSVFGWCRGGPTYTPATRDHK